MDPMNRIATSVGCEGCVADLAQAWAEVVLRVNPDLDVEQVRVEACTLASALHKAVTAGDFEIDAAREVGAGLEVWEHLELDHLLEMQTLTLRHFAGIQPEGRAGRAPAEFAQAVLVMGHGFYEARIERAQRLGMESMSRMSHDIKTPINAITGFSRVILKGIDGPITEFQEEDLTSIYEAGKKLLAMVNDLFAVRKRDAARPAVYGSSFEVATLVADVLRTVQPLAAESRHRFIVDLLGDLGSMTADPSMVRWIVLGLLMVAIRQMRQGTVRLSVRRERVAEVSQLSVRIGYEPSDEDQTSTEVGRAIGPEAEVADIYDLAREDLVLQTCLSFCETLGGELSSVRSQQGASFLAILPVRPPEALNED